jgi:site-specific recombinase XerD
MGNGKSFENRAQVRRAARALTVSSSPRTAAELAADAFAAEIGALPAAARMALGDLEARSVEHERAATSLATRKLYRERWSLFVRWATAHGLSSLPAHPDVLRLWLVSLERSGKSLSTLEVSAAAVRKAHALAGLETPNSDRLKQALRGLRRELGPKAKHAEAVSVTELRALVAASLGDRPTHPQGVRDRAVLLVLYCGGLRRSELCELDLSDVRRDGDGYLLTIRSSKTDQEGKGATVGLPLLDMPEICPVRALDAWLEARAHLPKRDEHGAIGAPLFPVLNKIKASGPWHRLEGQDVGRIMRSLATLAGFDARRYRPHGFRAGIATESSRRGASLKELQAHLRHKDIASTLRYVREGEALGAGNPARVLGKPTSGSAAGGAA